MPGPDSFIPDLLQFFDEKPRERALALALLERIDAMFSEASARVQKTQISFYNRRLFAAISLPVRRKKAWPRECIILTLGLGYEKKSPRVAVATEPYPNRFTHHIIISDEREIDDELAAFIREAYNFSQNK